jgi:hypothetical protein
MLTNVEKMLKNVEKWFFTSLLPEKNVETMFLTSLLPGKKTDIFLDIFPDLFPEWPRA